MKRLCHKKLHEYDTRLRQCPECKKISKNKYYNKNKANILDKKKNNYIKNKEKLIKKQKEYYKINKEKRHEYNKEYYIKKRSEILEQKKEYSNKNSTEISKYQKKWRINNKIQIKKYQKNYRSNNKIKYSVYSKERFRSNPLFRLSHNIRTLIRVTLKKKGVVKFTKTIDILCCSFKQLQEHLIQSAIRNYGIYDPNENYHIDHIIPISLARTEEEVIALNHYTNLQYLKVCDNLVKSNNIIIDGCIIDNEAQKILILENYLESDLI